MEGDIAEKMKNILCPLHNKKIHFLNLESAASQFFICSDCMSKNKRYCLDRMEYFVSVEDFRNMYLKKMRKELDIIRESIGSNVSHIENHIQNGEVSIEQDFERLSKALIDHIKIRVRECKNSVLTRFRDSNRSNLKSLDHLKGQIDEMLDEGNGIISRLNQTLNRQIENNSVLQGLLQGRLRFTLELLDKKRAYQGTVDQLRLLSTSFSFKDLVCEYRMEDARYENLLRSMKDQISNVFYKNVGTDDFRDEVIKKSSKAVKELKIESNEVFESPDFDKLKKSKLNLVGSYQTAKHSSHHVLCATTLSNAFLVTGHSDSTFKIWFMNPGYFQTSFTAVGMKAVAAKDLIEEEFSKKKKTSGAKAFQLVVLSLIRYS